jgi:hypothetical protein
LTTQRASSRYVSKKKRWNHLPLSAISCLEC